MSWKPIKISSPLMFGLVLFGVAVGTAAGIGAFTFIYAHGGAYMTNDPAACANCHIMDEQYNGWRHSSHHTVAVCNDCHTPHDFLGKYLTKALNGWHHSKAFTTGDFHEPIRIGERNRRITQEACRHCHQSIVMGIDAHAFSKNPKDQLDCLRCHESVGHMH